MTETNLTDTKTQPPMWQVNLIGIFYIILIIALGLLVYMLWPQYVTENNESKYVAATSVFGIELDLSLEQRTVILVLITGAIGSFIHSAGSFTNFVGEQRLESTWIWWYILRPFVGVSVAFVFYLVFRGGLLTDTHAENLNIYGILTLAALSGLFSDRATLKLKEVFDTMFQPKDERSGKLDDETDETNKDTKE